MARIAAVPSVVARHRGGGVPATVLGDSVGRRLASVPEALADRIGMPEVVTAVRIVGASRVDLWRVE